MVAGGAPYCWGWNDYGQLGNGMTSNSSVPVAVDMSGVLAGKTVSAVSGGSNHSCVVAGGAPYCWGYNGSGRLGNGMTSNSSVPVAVDTSGVLAGKTVTAVSAGGYHSCAVGDGAPYCWGANYYGQLGDGTVTSSSLPVAVSTSGVLAEKMTTAVSAGDSHTTAIAVTQSVPDAPRSPSATAGDGQVTVSWQAPASDGGSPVTKYVATASPGGAVCTTAGLSCTVTGLSNGTAYTFSVIARNALGDSVPAVTAPVTPTTRPVTPTEPPVTPTEPPVVVKQVQTAPKPPKRIKKRGVTVLTKKNTRTNAGVRIKTKVAGKAKKGKVRYFRVIKGPKGKVSVRTFGKKRWRLVLARSAPATDTFEAYRARTVYVNGKRR